ncbi:cyclin-B1-2-like [Pyrus ussuriensis x Pyrus communis]|uniref:Cyclin-B1-2-like n=1 Tax=Pyrus ussuriensis x Pyrus communis TaxID=2448454 RepID=A0A5N5FBD9_9ROSA|nr:cyclin-B1-2-like [Pyrus ussuriensis x Pyrus communis]
MEAPKMMEHQIGGIQNDTLWFGLHGGKSDLVGVHPLESALQSAKHAGPIPSSTLGLEAMNGRLDDFGFKDYLNEPPSPGIRNLPACGHIMIWKFALGFQRVQSPQALCDHRRLTSLNKRISNLVNVILKM